MTEHPLGSADRPLRVAVVGSGPSAFYAIEALFKAPGVDVRVDVFDRLPTPYGLVRGGVAPDHQKIKSVVKIYVKIADHPSFRFFGNVELGRDVQVDDLRRHYDQILYAVGNESDRWLGIPGEDLASVRSATEFVGWYNGHPDFADRIFDLESVRRVVVVGNGNVAMDVTRILVARPDELAATDIADYALAALRRSAVREVVLLGRRGPAQAAFSPKEIRELGELDDAEVLVDPADVVVDEVTQTWLDTDAPRSARRNLDYLTECSQRGERGAPRVIRTRFLVAPVEFIGKGGVLSGVRVQFNELYAADDGTPRPRALDRYGNEPAQLVLEAIGYRGVPIAGVPFDDRNGVIANRDGRVIDLETGEHRGGEYVVGWAKRGPTGLIGTNSPDSKATVALMLADAAEQSATALAANDLDAIPDLLRARDVDYASYADWQRLDRYEVECGQAKGKVRDKLTDVGEMMSVIRRSRS